MTRHYSAALPIAYVGLRILILLNWLYGVAVLGLLAYTFIDADWTSRALDVPAGLDEQSILNGLRTIAALGLVAVPLNHVILTRLLNMIETVRAGDPFVAANAHRLQIIAWALLFLQLLSLVIGAIGEWIASLDFRFDVDAGFSLTGWLAVILTFILSRVFAEGTMMREDLEATV